MIESFTADVVRLADGRHQITYTWQTSGAISVGIRLYSSERFVPGWFDLPPYGTHVVEIDPIYPNPDTVLTAYGPEHDSRSKETLALTFPCRYPYFFTTETAIYCNELRVPGSECPCPRHPAVFTSAVEQPFENGYMIWFQASSGGAPSYDMILVFYDRELYGREYLVEFYENTWTPDQPDIETALTPPEGRYQPIRGLGKLWWENTNVRHRIGWATAPEQPFEGAGQQLRTEALGAYAFFRTADGEIVLFGGSWMAGGGWSYFRP